MCFKKKIRNSKRVNSIGEYNCCICGNKKFTNGLLVINSDYKKNYFCNTKCYECYLNIKSIINY